jgi:hypothetical protein
VNHAVESLHVAQVYPAKDRVEHACTCEIGTPQVVTVEDCVDEVCASQIRVLKTCPAQVAVPLGW